jgi:hypothetical protein
VAARGKINGSGAIDSSYVHVASNLGLSTIHNSHPWVGQELASTVKQTPSAATAWANDRGSVTCR